jgi:two-component system response regulator RegA
MAIGNDQPLRQALTAGASSGRSDFSPLSTSTNSPELRAREYAVVEMRLEDGCGLDVVSALKQQRPDARAIILTVYGNIATAVSAVKLGAHDYLTKHVYVDDGWHPSSDRIGLPGFLALNPLRFQERRASH